MQYFSLILQRRGPLAAWWKLRDYTPPLATPEEQRDLFCLQARVLAGLRDFDRAWDAWESALRLGPDDSWVFVTQSSLLEAQDALPASLQAAQEALRLAPQSGPAACAAATALVGLGKDDDALAVLRQALRAGGSASPAHQLALLLQELDRPAECLEVLTCLQERVPLADEELADHIECQRATAHYLVGDHAAAIAGFSRLVAPSGFHSRFLARLKEAHPDRRRVCLPVPFVRQDHATCVPATLTSLCRFWGDEALHTEIAEAICYDGTSAHAERNWALQRGWHAREFTLTRESARGLIDRGVPFALTTRAPGQGHEQAVMGYDEVRDTLLIRDPGSRGRSEFDLEEGLSALRSSGPRAMVLLPAAEIPRLDGLILPDAEVYDQHHALLSALDRHDRAGAGAVMALLQQAHPNHRLTFQAGRALAGYDGNTAQGRQWTEALLRVFPEDIDFRIDALALLHHTAAFEDSLTLARRFANEGEGHPLLWCRLADLLTADARHHGEALRWLRRSERAMPGSSLSIRARLLWQQGSRSEACELFRFASCREETSESAALAWFQVACHLGKEDDALAALINREQRLGDKSSGPALTLFSAWMQLNETEEAFRVLTRARERRPSDGALGLFAARQHAQLGNLDAAETLLEAALSDAAPADAIRTAAVLASRKGDFAGEQRYWQALLDANPLDMEAHRALSLLLARTTGRSAVLTHLESVSSQFPEHVPLAELLVNWAAGEGPSAAEAATRRLLARNPGNAWCRQELATALLSGGRPAEALPLLDELLLAEPRNPLLRALRGEVCIRQGRQSEGAADCRAALTLSVDCVPAMNALVQAAPSVLEKRHELSFIQNELAHQTSQGPGYSHFARLVRAVLPAGEGLACLRALQSERPDLPESIIALGDQMLLCGLLDEAGVTALAATERFPLLAEAWALSARIHHARLDAPARVTALRRGLETSPDSGTLARELAAALYQEGRGAEAVDVLARSTQTSPTDTATRVMRAKLLWLLSRRSEAVDEVRSAVQWNCGDAEAWRLLGEWGHELQQPSLAVDLARRLSEQWPADPGAWLALARASDPVREFEGRLSALSRALALDPRLTEAWSLRALTLGQAGRYEEAAAACRPPAFAENPPPELLTTEAWLTGYRGNIERACAQLETVVARSPDHPWAWRLLADWRHAREDYAGAAEAAAALLRIDPLDTYPLLHSATAREKKGDTVGAMHDFSRAFALDPSLTIVGVRLFRQHALAGQWNEARARLNQLATHAPDALHVRLTVELAFAQGDIQSWPAHLDRLCHCTSDEPGPYLETAGSLVDAGFGPQAEMHLRQNLEAGGCHPNAAAAWVYLRVSLGWLDTESMQEMFRGRDESAVRAWTFYLSWLAQPLRQPRYLVAVRNRIERELHVARQSMDDWFRSHDLLWSGVGFLQAVLGYTDDTLTWLSDWRQRTNAPPHCLVIVVLILHELGRRVDAENAVASVLARPVRDEGILRFELWDALSQLATGNELPARRLLAARPVMPEDNYDSVLFQLLRLAIEGMGTGPQTTMSTRHIDTLRDIRELARTYPVLADYYHILASRLGW